VILRALHPATKRIAAITNKLAVRRFDAGLQCGSVIHTATAPVWRNVLSMFCDQPAHRYRLLPVGRGGVIGASEDKILPKSETRRSIQRTTLRFRF